jgi:hypothetical protein
MVVAHAPASAARDHDALVVALDAGDLAGPDQVRAEHLVASCAGCADLREDLATIRGALATLPVPARRRDYRLTDDDARRLRPGLWARLAGWLAAPGSSVRPLATGVATLGALGLLLTASLSGLVVPGAVPAAEDAAADPRARQEVYLETPAAAPVGVPSPDPAPEQAPPAEGDVVAPPAGAESGEANLQGQAERDSRVIDAADRAEQLARPTLLVVSALLLAAGLGLLLARTLALRRA